MPKLKKPKVDLRECPMCGCGAVLVTMRMSKTYWEGFGRCNAPSCGVRTPAKRNPQLVASIWNNDPDEDGPNMNGKRTGGVDVEALRPLPQTILDG